MLAFLIATIAVAQPLPSAEPDAVLRAGRACGYWEAKPVARRAPEGRVRALGELPRANHELAVLRLDANGCSRPVIVRRDVEFDGRVPQPRR